MIYRAAMTRAWSTWGKLPLWAKDVWTFLNIIRDIRSHLNSFLHPPMWLLRTYTSEHQPITQPCICCHRILWSRTFWWHKKKTVDVSKKSRAKKNRKEVTRLATRRGIAERPCLEYKQQWTEKKPHVVRVLVPSKLSRSSLVCRRAFGSWLPFRKAFSAGQIKENSHVKHGLIGNRSPALPTWLAVVQSMNFSNICFEKWLSVFAPDRMICCSFSPPTTSSPMRMGAKEFFNLPYLRGFMSRAFHNPSYYIHRAIFVGADRMKLLQMIK